MDSQCYTTQIKEMKNLLCRDADDEEVIECLGTSIAALYSVPTAIYCFLRAQKEIPGIKVRCCNKYYSLLFYGLIL